MAKRGTVAFQSPQQGATLTKIESASFSMGPGAQPSSGTIVTPPHTQNMPQTGDLTLGYDGTSFTLPDCAVVNASIDRSGGAELWTLTIVDRRWRWAYGGIKASYNIPIDPKADPIKYKREATPEDIARFILSDYLDEPPNNVDTSGLPSDMRPTLDFDFVTPAAALDQLCTETGCRLILRPADNKVGFVKIGEGLPVPGGPETGRNYSVARGDFPRGLLGVSGPISYDIPFTLEAVGEDLSGKVKLLDDLSYKPSTGWGDVLPPEFIDVWEGEPSGTTEEVKAREKLREICKKSIWRMYRIKEPVEDAKEWLENAFQDHLDSEGLKLRHFLPLLPKLVSIIVPETEDDEDEVNKPFEPMDPFIFGEYYAEGGDGKLTPDGNAQVDRSFSIDQARGLVLFDEPIYSFDSEDKLIEASLTLVVSCHLAFDRGYSSYVIVQYPESGGTVTPVQNRELYDTVLFPEVEPYVLFNDDGSKGDDNGSYVVDELNNRLAVYAQQYNEEPAGSVRFSGLIPQPPDGLAQQVNWQISGAGTFTTIGYKQELDPTVLTYREKVQTEENKTTRRAAYLDRKKKAREEFETKRWRVK